MFPVFFKVQQEIEKYLPEAYLIFISNVKNGTQHWIASQLLSWRHVFVITRKIKSGESRGESSLVFKFTFKLEVESCVESVHLICVALGSWWLGWDLTDFLEVESDLELLDTTLYQSGCEPTFFSADLGWEWLKSLLRLVEKSVD